MLSISFLSSINLIFNLSNSSFLLKTSSFLTLAIEFFRLKIVSSIIFLISTSLASLSSLGVIIFLIWSILLSKSVLSFGSIPRSALSLNSYSLILFKIS
ncbi:hypothetical protein [Mycoplasmopsis cynos]|uniref:hypothetical protein n=1 Tax=Mycoplasmopsis cynos TaxID=171284 RepID=UPI00220E8AE2|nr:hypothetical protein [Mycoplasmopsis cynos]MCU9935436.1 hypothetical protein [Mycoplasmopsis cynos]UWV80351.1 hypothetical protein NW069_03340 [Mycoplasmopsis cynos]